MQPATIVVLDDLKVNNFIPMLGGISKYESLCLRYLKQNNIEIGIDFRFQANL